MKGFKTVIFNVLASILPILESADFVSLMNDEFTALYGALIAFGNIYLRSKTDTKIFQPR